MLAQAVTTIWRTELGTTLIDGFDSTTDVSAYFCYLCSSQSAMPQFLFRMDPRPAGTPLIREYAASCPRVVPLSLTPAVTATSIPFRS